MDRRDTLKTLFVGSIAGGAVAGGVGLSSCKTNVEAVEEIKRITVGRTPIEMERDLAMLDADFFTPEEMETVAILSDIILPSTDTAGSATEADVPAFIDFMMQDMPKNQLQIRGGLAWLNRESNIRFEKIFSACTNDEQLAIIDDIAYPIDEPSPLSAGVKFFSSFRDLVLTGYYTSQIGLKDLGYKGNVPNVWEGVPQHVLDKHGLSYDAEWLAKCVDQNKRSIIAEWDDQGRLLT